MPQPCVPTACHPQCHGKAVSWASLGGAQDRAPVSTVSNPQHSWSVAGAGDLAGTRELFSTGLHQFMPWAVRGLPASPGVWEEGCRGRPACQSLGAAGTPAAEGDSPRKAMALPLRVGRRLFPQGARRGQLGAGAALSLLACGLCHLLEPRWPAARS